MLFVRCYRKELVGPDPKCSNVLLIRANASHSLFCQCSLVVSASRVEQQVFFSCVPDRFSNGHPWVWVLRYASSSFSARVDNLEFGEAEELDDDDDEECIVQNRLEQSIMMEALLACWA